MPPLRPITKVSRLPLVQYPILTGFQEDTHLNGHNTWFFDDIELVRQRWHSDNRENVAELSVLDLSDDYQRLNLHPD
jgi:terminal uridylyltransferase